MIIFFACFLLSFSISCTSKATDSSEEMTPQSSSNNAIEGIYEVSQVTCGGEIVPINVSAVVTFDDNSYLEEWSFLGAECTMTLDGTTDVSEDQLTIVDVEMSCSDTCDAEGITCHTEPCSSDQTYQINLEGDELWMYFTQQGDEFACGPCGEGVESSYLLTRTGDP